MKFSVFPSTSLGSRAKSRDNLPFSKFRIPSEVEGQFSARQGLPPHQHRANNLVRLGRMRDVMWGFTLLETIVALGIILGGISGAFGMAIQGLSSASVAKNKLVAANLAQEGIELVRRIRDNNTIADMSDGIYDGSPEWNAGIGSGTGCNRQYKIDVLNDTLLPYDAIPLRFDSATGLYTQSIGTESLFTRMIEIDRPPCPSPMLGINPSEQFKVSSKVFWTERGVSKEVTLDEILFNWR